MTLIETEDRAWIKLSGEFRGFMPIELFDYWTNPDLLTKWWPPLAEVDGRVGGAYTLSWPDQGWHLRGRYSEFESGRRLAFTWRWDHDPDYLATTTVTLGFEEIETGTRLTVAHGRWEDDDKAQEERSGVIEGWLYFGGQLEVLKGGAIPPSAS